MKRKLKVCKGCGLTRPIWKDGKCISCCRPTYGQLRTTTPLKKNRKGKPKEVVEFFKSYANTSGTSAESGKRIPQLEAKNIAHLLPKCDFPELATDPNNVVVLTWQEHTRFDELLGRHEFEKLKEEMPNTWAILKERFIKLEPKIKTQNKLSRELKIQIYDL